jgi:hypothetical protein
MPLMLPGWISTIRFLKQLVQISSPTTFAAPQCGHSIGSLVLESFLWLVSVGSLPLASSVIGGCA